jgi:ankyrin repeat protein
VAVARAIFFSDLSKPEGNPLAATSRAAVDTQKRMIDSDVLIYMRRGSVSILEAIVVELPDMFAAEILPKLDMTGMLNLAQVNKFYNKTVWSVDGVRSMTAKIRALVAAMEISNRKIRHEHSQPMYWAARFGNAPAVRALLKSGVDVNDIVDEAGRAALAIAAAYDQIAAINALVDAGADLNAQSEQSGVSPMCSAAESGRTAAVMALIRAGADMNLADLLGYTPLQLAAGGGYVACTAVLIQAGADISKVNGADMTPLDVAVDALVLELDGREIAKYEEISKLLRVAEKCNTSLGV